MSIQVPARPRLLGLLLDAKREKSEAIDDKYSSFVAHAGLAERECARICLSITASFQFKEEEQVASGMLQQARSGVLNEVIFAFYAKFNTGGASSFEGLANASETWSMFELELFFRDFRVIPKLCSREEVRGVWEEMSAIRKMKGLGYMSKLTIDDLCELLARLAVYIYSTLGMQRLVVAVLGHAPTPEAKIDYFCHYLHLDDLEFVKEHIRSVGRSTQGKANMIDGGTKEGTNKDACKQDNKYKKLASQAIAKSRMAGQTTKRVAGSKELGQDIASSIRNKAKAALAAAVEATELPENIESLLSVPSVVNFDPSISSSASKLSPNNKNANKPSLPTSPARQDSRPGSPSIEIVDASRAESPSSSVNRPNSQGSKRAKSPSSSSSRRGRRLPIEKKDVYLPYMADLLMPYVSESKKGDLRTNIIESHGPFMDMGRVPEGKTCTIHVNIKNGSPEELQVKIVARDFPSESKVTTLPRPIIPGISRHISITFIVDKISVPRSVVSFIDVLYSSRFFDAPRIVSIPVFYYTSSETDHTIRDMPILTLDSLPARLRDLCHAPVSLNKSFAKPSGSWRPTPIGSSSSFSASLSPTLNFSQYSLNQSQRHSQSLSSFFHQMSSDF